jgi:hypothetical protein
MKGQKIITLLTDFGVADSYVGVMKGVMLGINPELKFVDITHAVPAGDIKKGAFRLFTAYKFFPKSTIHLVVIDPGVGSKRKPIIVETKDYYFVGPDNGVFSWIYDREECKVYEIQEIPAEISNTFHGRDIFAPTAAKLSLEVKPIKLGREIKKYISFKPPTPYISQTQIKGEIIDIDKFGNLITNISKSQFYKFINNKQFEIKIKGHKIYEVKTSYEGENIIAIFGSTNFLEISLPRGNCASLIKADIGNKITITKQCGK